MWWRKWRKVLMISHEGSNNNADRLHLRTINENDTQTNPQQEDFRLNYKRYKDLAIPVQLSLCVKFIFNFCCKGEKYKVQFILIKAGVMKCFYWIWMFLLQKCWVSSEMCFSATADVLKTEISVSLHWPEEGEIDFWFFTNLQKNNPLDNHYQNKLNSFLSVTFYSGL